jgi:uncharacterized repeat protein (TIGR03943 family)
MARSYRSFLPWVDVLAIAAWGVLFLKYWVTGKLFLLIHPNYTGLTVVAGFALLAVAALRAFVLLRQRRRPIPSAQSPTQHISLFPPGWASLLLLGTAILGLLITPRAFASETAVDRGVADTLTVTRGKPQEFRTSSKSEERSLIEWIRTLTVYPEPDAYTGQKVKVTGFVIYPPNLGDQYLLISRFIITCCAADAYPVSLPVKLTASRSAYKPDSWLEIEGQMITETLADKRQLVIEAKSLKPIEEPKNPYDY